jgi:predicted acetyltransferase
VLTHLWQLYRHDLSEFWGTMPAEDGTFPLGRLPRYLDDPDRRAYLLLDASTPVGFVCVRGLAGECRVMGDFFVVRAMRRRGVGRKAALAAFRAHPGRWEIPFQDDNTGAARFWRQVATTVAGDAWQEERRPVPGRPDLPPDVWISFDAS